MSRFSERFGGRIRARSIYMLLLYALILICIACAALIPEKKPETENYGTLEGRFESDITLSYNNSPYYYREHEITNYLLIGMDRDSFVGAGHQNGGQADFLLMLSVDRRNRTITPVLIDRDTMTSVQTYGAFGNAAGKRTMQICLAQAYSGSSVTGSENTASAVSSLLYGVKADRVLVMNLGGIVLLNDAIGGVTVTVEDDMTALDPALEQGATVHLTGDMAESFVRGRMGIGDGTNASRMRRQSAYINALVETLREKLAEDDGFASEVLDILSGHMETSVPENTLLNEANAYGKYDWQPLVILPGMHAIGEDGFAEFWPDQPALTEMAVGIWFAESGK